jgi:hypothetical protein
MKNKISILLTLSLVTTGLSCNSSKEGNQPAETTGMGGNDGSQTSTSLPSNGGSNGTHLTAPTTSTGGHSTNNTHETTASSGGGGGTGTGTGSNNVSTMPPTSSNCETVLPLYCGDRLNHSTITQGRANRWSGYNSTQRLLSGRETVYYLMNAKSGSVSVKLGSITEDLDLLLLSSCEPMTNTIASSTPLDLQTEEAISFTTELGKSYYVVVDGYSGAEGSYTLQVDCTNP